MEHLKRFFTWPRRPGNSYVSWPLLAWRFIWIGPALLMFCLTCMLVGIGWGPSSARDVWKSVW